MADELDPNNSPFRHYSFKQQCVAWISIHLFDHIIYTARHGLVKGMKRKGGLGWLPGFIDRSSETAEHRFLTNLDLRGKVVYDVGAFQGMLTLFFAQRARKVICYEPNNINRTRLHENVDLNGLTNVVIRNIGIGSEKSKTVMVSSALMPGGAIIKENIVQALPKPNTKVMSQSIEITTLDQDILDMTLDNPDFIKIDIEGAELSALVGLKQTLACYAPALFLEIHGETMNQKRKNVSDIVRYLTGFDYRIVHIETGSQLTLNNAVIGARGHLYAYSRNDFRMYPIKSEL